MRRAIFELCAQNELTLMSVFGRKRTLQAGHSFSHACPRRKRYASLAPVDCEAGLPHEVRQSNVGGLDGQRFSNCRFFNLWCSFVRDSQGNARVPVHHRDNHRRHHSATPPCPSQLPRRLSLMLYVPSRQVSLRKSQSPDQPSSLTNHVDMCFTTKR